MGEAGIRGRKVFANVKTSGEKGQVRKANIRSRENFGGLFLIRSIAMLIWACVDKRDIERVMLKICECANSGQRQEEVRWQAPEL